MCEQTVVVFKNLQLWQENVYNLAFHTRGEITGYDDEESRSKRFPLLVVSVGVIEDVAKTEARSREAVWRSLSSLSYRRVQFTLVELVLFTGDLSVLFLVLSFVPSPSSSVFLRQSIFLALVLWALAQGEICYSTELACLVCLD